MTSVKRIDLFNYKRLKTSVVNIGDIPMGGEHPIRLQSMTNTPTLDTQATVEQCKRIIDAGADDISHDNGFYTITTSMESFGPMMKKLESMKIEPENAQLQRIPKETITLSTEDAKKVLKLIDMIEEDDDVQNVYHNLELTDELIAAMD